MKYETFRLNDLSIKGEGNLHVIVLNSRTGQVFRFPKESRRNNENLKDQNTENLDLKKLYKIAINYKKYNVLQKYWGKKYLPKIRVCLFPKQIIEQIALYLEDQRLESRRKKSIITKTSYVEVQPDLSLLPIEYNNFTDGITYCVELKTKFGLLLKQKNDLPTDCRNKMSRFCIGQLKKTDKTNYCPCDMFSGDPMRMSRAIKSLIVKPQEKLRIFQNGILVTNIDKNIITQLMQHLFPKLHINENESVDKFCNLIIEALLYDVSTTKKLIELPFQVSTNCHAHSWSNENTKNSLEIPFIYNGSVLGRIAVTSCLVDNKTEEFHELNEKLNLFLEKNDIEKKENIFDLWNEHLLPLDLPPDIVEIVRLLKKFLVSLTIRDCSIMMKFKKASVDKLTVKQSNASILKHSDGSLILTMSDIIDISIKPMSKIKSNFEYEQELVKLFQ